MWSFHVRFSSTLIPKNFIDVALLILKLFIFRIWSFRGKLSLSQDLWKTFITISKSKRCFNAKSSTYYFQMKTKILADFQICINVPLKSGQNKFCFYISHSKFISKINVHLIIPKQSDSTWICTNYSIVKAAYWRC